LSKKRRKLFIPRLTKNKTKQKSLSPAVSHHQEGQMAKERDEKYEDFSWNHRIKKFADFALHTCGPMYCVHEDKCAVVCELCFLFAKLSSGQKK